MASHYYSWDIGDVHYVKRGWGDPLLLVHNLYVGASRDEFEHNVAALSQHFTVHAIDLLGFGDSDVPRVRYTADLYVRLLGDFVRDVLGGHDRPWHAAASGLSCAYLARLAVWRPGMLRSLVMICPRSEPTGMVGSPLMMGVRHFLLSHTLGGGFYETMAGRHELRTFLAECFHSPARHVMAELVERLHERAMRRGAHLPYAGLLSGLLDSPILRTLPHVSVPTLLLWGRHARPTPVEHSVRLAALLRSGRLQVVENAGSWIHAERSVAANRAVIEFCEAAEAAATAPHRLTESARRRA
ncbi:MAG TPA: alpha/beta fold hydrolase [Tepidisphaeraceae bacterium]|nr:alpha/beta fold hydrolase [Tepidisphaeraceae bacterium]